jgi:hypothetical protein
MKDSKQIQADIEDLQASVAPALLEIKKLEQELSDALSREFIAMHNITFDMVQTSNIENVRIYDLPEFGKWMKESKCTKPWAEWNGRLYKSEEIKIGVLRPKAPGRIEHVPVNFWHAANLAFTDKERESFNVWKTEIYDASEKLSSACIHVPDDERFSYYIDKSRELHKIICAIPFLSQD